MTIGRRGSILATSVVLALPALGVTAAAQARKVTPVERGQTPASMGVHGFSVVLVVGYSQGALANETVPEAARTAAAAIERYSMKARPKLHGKKRSSMLFLGAQGGVITRRIRGRLRLSTARRESCDPRPECEVIVVSQSGSDSARGRFGHCRQFTQHRSLRQHGVFPHLLILLGHFRPQETAAAPATNQFLATHFAAIGTRDFVRSAAHHLAVQLVFRDRSRFFLVKYVMAGRTLSRIGQ